MEHNPGSTEKGSWKGWLWMIGCCAPFVILLILGYCNFRQ